MNDKILRYISLCSFQILAFCLTASAQGIGIGFKSGVRIATRTEAVYNNEKVNVRPSDKSETKNGIDIIHRRLIDSKNGTFIAYDIEVTRAAEPEQFIVTLKPGFQVSGDKSEINETARKAEAAKDPRLRELDLLTSAEAREKSLLNKPLTVRNGDIIKFEVYENTYKKAKIIDYIKIYDDSKPFAISFSELQPTRDFTLDDINLRLENFEIFVNGKMIGKIGGGASGSNIYFTVPERGRIIVSPFAREGYNLQKIGIIVDNKLTFTIGANKYEVVSKSPILGDGGNWNAWILHDPNYQKTMPNPNDPNAIQIGAGDLKFFFNKPTKNDLEK